MSFRKVNKSSYGRVDYRPGEASQQFSKDYAFESTYQRPIHTRQANFYRSPKTSEPIAEITFGPIDKDPQPPLPDYPFLKIKPTSVNPQDRISTRNTSSRYEQASSFLKSPSHHRLYQPNKYMTKSNNAIYISDRESIEHNVSNFRKSNDYERTSRNRTYRTDTYDFGTRNEVDDQWRKSKRYQQRNQEMTPLFSPNFKKVTPNQATFRPTVNANQRSLQLLQTPSYEDLKRRLHSQDF